MKLANFDHQFNTHWSQIEACNVLVSLFLGASRGCLVDPWDPFGSLGFLEWSKAWKSKCAQLTICLHFASAACRLEHARTILQPWCTEHFIALKTHFVNMTLFHTSASCTFFIYQIFSSFTTYHSLQRIAYQYSPPHPIFSVDWAFEEDQQTGSNGVTHPSEQGRPWMCLLQLWISKVWFELIHFGLMWFGKPICWIYGSSWFKPIDLWFILIILIAFGVT